MELPVACARACGHSRTCLCSFARSRRPACVRAKEEKLELEHERSEQARKNEELQNLLNEKAARVKVRCLHTASAR